MRKNIIESEIKLDNKLPLYFNCLTIKEIKKGHRKIDVVDVSEFHRCLYHINEGFYKDIIMIEL